MISLETTRSANTTKQIIPSFDFMRVVCAVIVVIAHTQSKAGSSQDGRIVSEIVSRIAVPFFFMISGYFLSLALTKKQDMGIILKYLRRIIVTYTLWSIIYYTLTLLFIIKNNKPILTSTKHFIFNYFTIGSSYQLWYFPALILNVIVFAVFYKLKKMKLLIGISILLYIIGLLGLSYYRVGLRVPVLHTFYTSPQFTPINRAVLIGVPFFVLGYIMNISKKYFNKMSSKVSNKIIILIIVCFLLEIVLVKKLGVSRDISLTVFLYILTGWINIVCLKNPMANVLKDSMKYRYISNFTYYSHPIYIRFIDIFFSKIFNQSLTQLQEVLMVCLLTTITVVIIVKINNKYLLKLVS